MKLIFASSNEHKTFEIKKMLPKSIQLSSLKELNFFEEIEETESTFEGNALLKATFVFERFGENCFADDSGLEIEALNGEPGVYSARYAGEPSDSEKNIRLVLAKMKGKAQRNAQFKTVIALFWNQEIHLFEGSVNGIIREEKTGSSGFGYDPIFEPENQGRTFAEMSPDEKNKFSHRARALEKMLAFLKDKT